MLCGNALVGSVRERLNAAGLLNTLERRGSCDVLGHGTRGDRDRSAE